MMGELMFLPIMARATHVQRERERESAVALPVFIVRLCITSTQGASLMFRD